MRYGIGIDGGIASIGAAVVALDDQDNPCGIIDFGVRIFDTAEHPKNGSSLALPRREARSSRRRIRRHRHRNERIRQLIINRAILTSEQLENLFSGQLENIYFLRVKALDEIVTNEEFARILIHISQRRGFRSNRKNPTDKEDGKLLSAVAKNKERMEISGYRTVGEMLLKDSAFSEHKRNKADDYLTTVSRAMIEDEVKQIFSAQRKLGNDFADEEMEEQYLSVLMSQRSFDEGPGGDSRYGGNQIAKMVGKCTFEPEEPRAAKATFSFQYFNLLSKINNIMLLGKTNQNPLSDEQRKTLIASARKTENLTFGRIRKELGLDPSVKFNYVPYHLYESMEDAEKKTKFSYLKDYHKIRKELNKIDKKIFPLLTENQLDQIGTALTYYKTDDSVTKYLSECGFPEELINAVCGIGNFSKFGHLSLKALRKINPYLEEGAVYSEACEKAGYSFLGHEGTDKDFLLHPKEEDYADITSPVVKRAVSQCFKVINAIIRKQGCSPVFVNVELARELSKDFLERKNIEKQIKENREKNEFAVNAILKEIGMPSPNGLDILKYKLYSEQNGISPYSQKPIKLDRLFEKGYVEIDHIVPYSVSFDDRFNNKVLVFTEENRNKGNRLPLEYLEGTERENYISWVNTSVHNKVKKKNLLKEHISEYDRKQFKERNLQDTKYISRYILNYLNDHLIFDDYKTGKMKHVKSVNGATTAYVRKRWGISKVRADGDSHHAVDALVVACMTDSMIQKVSKYSQYHESRYTSVPDNNEIIDVTTGEIIDRFPYPWDRFRHEMEARFGKNPKEDIDAMLLPFYLENDVEIHPLFVSRVPKYKTTGAAHEDTYKSIKGVESGYCVKKVDIKNLKLDSDGEIKDYYNPQSDILLYEALKKKLRENDNDGEKAFSEPFFKPKSDGMPGNPVRKVKIVEKSTLNVPVLHDDAVADNGSMVRIDVFYVDGDGYYFVPIYVADTVKKELPNKACVSGKKYQDWKEMKDEDFLFSLYPNDLIHAEHRDVIKLSKINKESTIPDSFSAKDMMLYFKKASISTGAIRCINHDNTYEISSLGIKTLIKLEKYVVDVLGNYHKVSKEKRSTFHCAEDDLNGFSKYCN